MVTPLLIVIVTFGLIFVATASLAQGFSMQPGMLRNSLRGHSQTTAMIVLGNFALLPALTQPPQQIHSALGDKRPRGWLR